jgi:hypothetical protein
MRRAQRKFHFLKVETIVRDHGISPQGLVPVVFNPIDEYKLIRIHHNLATPTLSAGIRVASRGPRGKLLRLGGGRYHRVVAKRSVVNMGVSFVSNVVPQLIRPIRSLWHEIIGFLFLSLAFLGAVSAVRVARNFTGEPSDLFRLVITALFVIVMGGYGVSSFRRARKISRS